MEFGDYAKYALLAGEKRGAVCSFCGEKLRTDYYLLLSGWQSATKELVSPQMRFCSGCWKKIEHVVCCQVRQTKLPI